MPFVPFKAPFISVEVQFMSKKAQFMPRLLKTAFLYGKMKSAKGKIKKSEK